MKKSTGEIRALITLLGDDDGGIRNVARERLFEFGAEAEDYLREATNADLEGKVRIEARHVLEKIRQEDLLGSFYLLGLRDDEEIDLEHTAFLLARFGYSDVEVAEHQRELDEMAERVRIRLARLDFGSGGRLIVETINQILFKEEGFYGNTKTYYDPDNTYLNRVLERRTGIPVTLSLVYLLLARRLRLPMRGINMPVHFICQYHTAQESFYFDPFNNGRIITRAECAMILRNSGYTLEGDSLRPASPRTMLSRMIRNLVLIYEHQSQHEKAMRLDRILKMLRTNG
ncbi:MAG: transglutaminase-like domain-containing protein [candidate division KSB1 bacterium]